jgi:hypothetical protein
MGHIKTEGLKMQENHGIFIIEQGSMIVIRESEGRTKGGENKRTTMSKFKEPMEAAKYLKQKHGVVSKYLEEKYGIKL